MLQSWRTGAMKGLEELIMKSFVEHPDIYERLLAARNRNWVPKIIEFTKREENVLVIVGAGHMVGTDGLVALLQEMGYKPKQR